ncbi:protein DETOXIFICATION 44, chloroplastic [Sesamum angolense]|uniref:Protein DETOXIFICATION n=1 Tax=Sesamum angolense TaxID=2727404 RepID=A0AAE2BSF0_9LAMI|nr:protein DETOXIFICATION 44, chloroplastic [Sesamum angolense]
MASAVIHQHRWRYRFSVHANCCFGCNCYSPNPSASQFRCLTTFSRGCKSIRFRTTTKASADKNPSTIPQKRKSRPADDGVGASRPDSDPGTKSFSVLLRRLWEGFKLDGLGMEILSIAMPAALALAADPITSLVDTGFVGHLGSAELAAVGVSGAVFNLVSKLFNVPLLNVTTSFVAEEQAALVKAADDYSQTAKDPQSKISLPSVSNAIILAAALGIIEAVALSTGSSFLMNTMGIPVDSPMHMPAEQFLTLRALGAPPIVVALAAQGTFRGFKDTKTPLYAVGAGNLLNAILDPILIFSFGLGIGGAAIATVISEYLTALILLWKLSDEVLLIAPSINGQRIVQYLKSGALLTARTLAVLAITTLATSMAARGGPIQMAGHQICFEVWLALSLLNDALALAGQTLLASDYSQGNYGLARQVTYKVLQVYWLTNGVALAVILFLGFGALSSLFSTDSEVLEIARSGTLFVAGSQPMNAIAFVLDGLYYGVSDFGFAAYSMVFVGLISSVFLLLTAPSFGLAGVWGGLFLFMTLRVVVGMLRLSTRSGPWRLLWLDTDKDSSLPAPVAEPGATFDHKYVHGDLGMPQLTRDTTSTELLDDLLQCIQQRQLVTSSRRCSQHGQKHLYQKICGSIRKPTIVHQGGAQAGPVDLK